MISKYKESLFKLKHFPISWSETLSLEYTDTYRGGSVFRIRNIPFEPDPDPSDNVSI